MRVLMIVSLCMLLLAGVAVAGPIDGTWTSERKMERDGQSTTITQTFEFKSEGSKLTGTVTMKFGERDPVTSEIKEGTVDGNKFSFVMVRSGPNGEMKLTYTGTVEGDTLKGASSREGGQSRPFEAKRK